MTFFRKGLESLEGVDPQVRLVSEKLHIDYQFGGLDDGEDGESETMNSYENNDDGELSFDYRHNKQGFDNDSTSRISMEVILFPSKRSILCLPLILVTQKHCLLLKLYMHPVNYQVKLILVKFGWLRMRIKIALFFHLCWRILCLVLSPPHREQGK